MSQNSRSRAVRRTALAALAFILISAFLCAPAGGGEISVVEGVTHVLNGAEPAVGRQTIRLEEMWRAGGEDGEPRRREVVATPIAPSSVTQVRSMLESVVLDGTGRAAAVDGYRVAGKTGTSQKIDPRTKGYSNKDYVAIFVGFVPVSKPRLLILIMVGGTAFRFVPPLIIKEIMDGVLVGQPGVSL